MSSVFYSRPGTARLLAAAASALSLLLSLSLSLPAAAQVFYSAGGSARADASGFGQSVSLPVDIRSAGGPSPVGSITTNRYAQLTGGNGFVSALAQTSGRPALGGVHVQAYTLIESQNGDPLSAELGYTVADATGSFSDFFVLNVPGYAPGTLFSITAGVRVDAFTALTPTISNNVGASTFETAASWFSRAAIFSANGGAALVDQNDSLSCWQNQSGAGCAGTGDGWRTLSFTMPSQSWAAQVLITGRARTSSQAFVVGGGGAYVTALADLGHTIGWGGISSVVDPAGNAVTAFSALSASSGFDYRRAYVSAVPEPASALLWLAGVVAIGVMKRHRAR